MKNCNRQTHFRIVLKGFVVVCVALAVMLSASMPAAAGTKDVNACLTALGALQVEVQKMNKVGGKLFKYIGSKKRKKEDAKKIDGEWRPQKTAVNKAFKAYKKKCQGITAIMKKEAK